jgi:hypothetical protein
MLARVEKETRRIAREEFAIMLREQQSQHEQERS